jgi:sigma-B regulation protein RsbU (phosphoserine phosphatase)
MLRARVLPVSASSTQDRTAYIDDTELATAARLQRALLPPSPFSHGDWSVAHHFAPAAAVGGDIVDLVPNGDRLFFVLADVAGKGVGASLVTAYLHAIFRSLVPMGLALQDLMARASALLCSSTLPWQYATLVAGYLGRDGDVEIANAGHPSPLVLSAGRHADLVPTGTPAGMFCDSRYGTTRVTLADGDTLLLYSDGVSETLTDAGNDYGETRLREIARAAASLPVSELMAAVVSDHARVAGTDIRRDDVTLLAVRRQGGGADRRPSADSKDASSPDRRFC